MNRVVGILTFGVALGIQGVGCFLNAHEFASDWEGVIPAVLVGDSFGGTVRFFQLTGALSAVFGFFCAGLAGRRLLSGDESVEGSELHSPPWGV